MSRQDHLLSGLSRASKIIEIGPSFNPLAPKADGWNVFTVDHDSQEGLRRKYAKDEAIDESRIEPVDFVWSGGSLIDAIPPDQRGTFDAFVARHVIEHTTDIVDFLSSAAQALKPDGTVVLVVPDKRKCFDFFRPLSSLGQAIEAHRERRSRHRLATHIDHLIYHSRKADSPGWSIHDTEPQRLYYDLSVLRDAEARAEVGEYVDAHQWVFTPASFELLVVDLVAIGAIDLRVERIEEDELTEFFVMLRKGAERLTPEELSARRVALMNTTVIELAEQSRQIPGSPLARAGALSSALPGFRTSGLPARVTAFGERIRRMLGR